MEQINETSLDTLCAALAEVMGIPAPKEAAPAVPALTEYAETVFGQEKSGSSEPLFCVCYCLSAAFCVNVRTSPTPRNLLTVLPSSTTSVGALIMPYFFARLRFSSA